MIVQGNLEGFPQLAQSIFQLPIGSSCRGPSTGMVVCEDNAMGSEVKCRCEDGASVGADESIFAGCEYFVAQELFVSIESQHNEMFPIRVESPENAVQNCQGVEGRGDPLRRLFL